MSLNEIQADRIIQVYKFSSGFVSVPREDVAIGDGGFMPGFETDDGYYCFHSNDYSNKDRMLYRGPAPKASDKVFI